MENDHAASAPLNKHTLPLEVRFGFYPPITLATPTRDVLAYIFAPPENTKFVFYHYLLIISFIAFLTEIRYHFISQLGEQDLLTIVGEKKHHN